MKKEKKRGRNNFAGKGKRIKNRNGWYFSKGKKKREIIMHII